MPIHSTFEQYVKDAAWVISVDYEDTTDIDLLYDAAHEYADSHEDVIYTYNHRQLYAAGLLDDFIDEVYEYGYDGSNIDRLVQFAAYCMIRQAFMTAALAKEKSDD